MIKRLQRRFVLFATGAVALVILVLMAAINISGFVNMDQQMDAVLSLLAENEGVFPQDQRIQVDFSELPADPTLADPVEGAVSAETPYETRFFTVTIKGDGQLAEVNTGSIAAISTEKAVAIARHLMTQNSRAGYYGSYKYLAQATTRGRMYVFVDCSQRLSSLRSFLLSSVAVSAVGILLVFLLTMAMSRRAISPIVESYDKQKEFITNAGHELKTPLAVIDSCATVLELEHGESKWVSGIREQILRMNTLTQSLISLARMEEFGEHLLKERFCISKTFQEVLVGFQAVADGHGKRLSVELPDELWYVGNEEALTQLCSILTDNALKYADEGSEIRITLRQSGQKLLFITENQTRGLKPGSQKHLFERFYRGQGNASGHGIGLSMAQSIVAAHDGTMDAVSHDGSILRITVTLI